MGLKVIACASSDEKLEFAKQHGAEIGLNYAKEDLKEGLKKLTGGKGVDIVFDPVGGAYAEAALRSVGVGRPLPGDRICRRRNSKDPAQPRAAERLRHPRRVLGRMGKTQPGKRTAPICRSSCSGPRKARSHPTSIAPSRWRRPRMR